MYPLITKKQKKMIIFLIFNVLGYFWVLGGHVGCPKGSDNCHIHYCISPSHPRKMTMTDEPVYHYRSEKNEFFINFLLIVSHFWVLGGPLGCPGGPVFDSTIWTSPTSPVDNGWWASVSLDYYGTEKNALFPIFKIFGYFWVLRGHVGAMHNRFPEPLCLN